jgi:hypothetical protein
MKQTLTPALARVFKRLHYPLDVILMCVRWYVTYGLSVRNLEEMMAERGIQVDHSTVHRWAIKLLPVLEKAFRRHKRPVGRAICSGRRSYCDRTDPFPYRVTEVGTCIQRLAQTASSEAFLPRCHVHRAYMVSMLAASLRSPETSVRCTANMGRMIE